MGRHAALAWAVIAVFLAFAVSLPLDHVCFNESLDSTSSADTGVSGAVAACPIVGGPGQEPVQKSDTCAACLWSQTLILEQSPIGLPVANSATPNPQQIDALPIPLTLFLESISKRGPPAHRLI